MINKLRTKTKLINPARRVVSVLVSLAMVFSVLTLMNPVKAADEYKVTNATNNAIEFTVKHMLNGSEIYKETSVPSFGAGTSFDYNKAVNYTVSSVLLNGNRVSNMLDIKVTDSDVSNGKVTMTVNYTAKSVTNALNAPVTFYDYDINNNTTYGGSINNTSNYNSNAKKDSQTYNGQGNMFAVGQIGDQTNNDTDNSGFTDSRGNYVKMNYWSSQENKYIRQEIITSLSGNKYTDVNFNSQIYAPDLFSDDDYTTNPRVIGKKVLNNYKLNFSQSGDTFTLENVYKDGVSNPTYTRGVSSDFLPLNSETNGSKNFYFGMRYDYKFKLNDYTGILNYTFTGDDDVWVFIDGHRILDVGGIHGVIARSVSYDVKTGAVTETTDAANSGSLVKQTSWDWFNRNDETSEHQLTVIYMERGASVSNCSMQFTLPNAAPLDIHAAPETDITITKMSSGTGENDGATLSGAKFIVTDSSNQKIGEYTSGSNGKFTITGLKPGTYTLTETAPPTGHVILPGEGIYKIKVTQENDGSLNARLYKADGTTLLANNVIYNTSEREIEKVDIDKTAHVKSWDDRTYTITLTAKSNKTVTTTSIHETEGQKAKNADVMLVLDVSGSMGYTLVEGTSTSTYNSHGNYSSFKSSMNTNGEYYVKVDGEYEKVSYRSSRGEWYYWDSYTRHYLNEDNDVIYTRTVTTTPAKTRLDSLKEAANSFIDKLAKESPNSKVGITAFNTSLRKDQAMLTLNSANVATLKGVINGLSATGGTSPNVALSPAKDKLDALKDDGNNKYVILFSDGAPTGGNNVSQSNVDNKNYWDNTVVTSTQNLAAGIKNAGYKLYTVGLGMGANGEAWLKNNVASDPSYATTTDSADGLKAIFDNLSEAIAGETTTETSTKTMDVEGATVVDTLDNRFELTAAQRLALAGKAVVTDNADGTTTITWNNQTIPTTGKTYTLEVRAKDSFMGDNNVKTNVKPNSYVETRFGDKTEFPLPHVNVKAVNDAKDYATTRFVGETLDATKIKTSDTATATQNVKDIMSTKASTSGYDVSWTRISGSADMTKITEDSEYKMTIKYDVADPTNESNSNTDGLYNKEEDLTKTGTFKVNFKTGKLKITKTINEQYTTGTTNLVDIADNDTGLATGLNEKTTETNKYTQSNQTFIYKIQHKVAGNVKKTFYATLTFDSKDDVATKSTTIHNLEKGEYTVTEETKWSAKYGLVHTTSNNGGSLYEYRNAAGEAVATASGNNMMIGYRENTSKNYFTGLDDDIDNNAGWIDTIADGKITGSTAATFTTATYTRDKRYVTSQAVEANFTNNKKTDWYWYSDSGISVNKYVYTHR